MAPAVGFEPTTKRLTAAGDHSQKALFDRHRDTHGPKVSKRRRRGTGSIYHDKRLDYWVAKLTVSGRFIKRYASTEDGARQALGVLALEFAREDLLPVERQILENFGYLPLPVKSPRVGMSPKLRFAVFTRDGFRCRYCGATGAETQLVVDHAISVKDGGSDDISNLVTACQPCNAGKSGRSVQPEDIPA